MWCRTNNRNTYAYIHTICIPRIITTSSIIWHCLCLAHTLYVKFDYAYYIHVVHTVGVRERERERVSETWSARGHVGVRGKSHKAWGIIAKQSAFWGSNSDQIKEVRVTNILNAFNSSKSNWITHTETHTHRHTHTGFIRETSMRWLYSLLSWIYSLHVP